MRPSDKRAQFARPWPDWKNSRAARKTGHMRNCPPDPSILVRLGSTLHRHPVLLDRSAPLAQCAHIDHFARFCSSKETGYRLNVDTRAMDKIATMLPGAPDHHRKLVADLGGRPAGHRPGAGPDQDAARGRVLVHPTPQGCLEAEMAGNPAGLFKLACNSANLNMRGSGGRI